MMEHRVSENNITRVIMVHSLSARADTALRLSFMIGNWRRASNEARSED